MGMPASMHAIMPHLACDKGRNPIHGGPMPSHACSPGCCFCCLSFPTGHAWVFLREISSDAKTSQTWVILHHPETASCRERPTENTERRRETTWQDEACRTHAHRKKRYFGCLFRIDIEERAHASWWGLLIRCSVRRCSDTFQKVTL